ncbi:transglycosylase SLT domain-containing protein [Aromatoleum sp.]|uniref:transglycosylase SLT domain-containing protein n=1 Tax=Aromatoleum sp. TaxID=2307007 RepID=UPI002FC802EC
MKPRSPVNSRCHPVLPWLVAASFAGTPALAADPPRGKTPSPSAQPGGQLVAQGLAFEHGEGVQRDTARAAALYCEAARLGNADGMHALGWMYANGRGMQRSDTYAAALFAMAAAKGNAHAQQMLRFTGSGNGKLPECMRSPGSQVASAGGGDWSIESHIRALSAERQRVARLVVEMAPTYQISPRFALAIAVTESALNPMAVSPKNAMGVMQLIPDTAARFNVRNPFDPKENIRGGLSYLRWLLAYFAGDVALAAAAYNAGEGNVDRYRGVPPFPETRAYVTRILNFVQQREHPFDSSVAAPSAIFRLVRAATKKEGDL